MVILASVMALVTERASALREAAGVPVRTIPRWSTWWHTVFVTSALWQKCRARMVPPLPQDAAACLVARTFRATTLERWYYRARETHKPIVALERKVPRHAGAHPSVGSALAVSVAQQYRQHPT